MDGDDFLRECMSEVGQMPVDAFNRTFCVVCPHRPCVRSGLRQSAFDRRARTWKDVLFDKVPRADDMDPSFDHIRSKRFLSSGGTQATVAVQDVRSPARFALPAQEVHVIGFPDPDFTAPERGGSGSSARPVLQDTDNVATSPELPSMPPISPPLQDNTDFEQGSFVGDAPAPATPPSAETVMAPGQAFTFGSDE